MANYKHNGILSKKALGKRPVTSASSARRSQGVSSTPSVVDEIPPAIPSAGPSSATQARQKRILPSRSRRGGPGIGSSDIDNTILEMLQRRGENEPLIPPTSVFVLTTDSSLVPSPGPSNLGINALANDRYFERPEVMKACAEQSDIQTPEFKELTHDALVGGRLRNRGDEEPPDLSDAAYERRHRKFEAFEKRQKVREKEKLQYEHHKLKERIEQLRAMDTSAFLALPLDTFEEWDRPPEEEELDDSASPGESQEGEWRRRIVLQAASTLEERYRTLLPNERKTHEKLRTSKSMSVEPSIVSMDDEPEIDMNGMEADEEDELQDMPESSSTVQNRRVMLRLPPPPPPPEPNSRRLRRKSTITPSVEPEHIANGDIVISQSQSISAPPTKAKTRERSAIATAYLAQEATSVYNVPPPAQNQFMNTWRLDPAVIPVPHAPDADPLPSISTRKKPRTKSPLQQPIEVDRVPSEEAYQREYPPSSNGGPPLETTIGPSANSNVTHISHESQRSEAVSTGRRHFMPAILVAASHNEGPEARKTSRQLMAFGVKFPSFDHCEFEIPSWAFPHGGGEELSVEEKSTNIVSQI